MEPDRHDQYFWWVLVWAAIFAMCFSMALGQEAPEPGHGHPPEHMGLHDKFYSTWMRPDIPGSSCCSNQDCYPTQARRVKGHWEALRREDKKWVVVPENKIERNRDMPDAQAHLCAHAPYYENGDTTPSDSDGSESVICFGVGAGG